MATSSVAGVGGSGFFGMVSRRDFVRSTAACALGAGTLATLCGCGDSTAVANNVAVSMDVSTAQGRLNFAYAVAQMSYDFSTRLVLSPYPGITLLESATYSSIASHDGIHSTFLQSYITHQRITDLLLFNFSTVDFGSQASVMSSASQLAAVVAAAYAWLATQATDIGVATLLQKMASVKSRHASFLQDLGDVRAGTANHTNFAADDVVNAATGLTALLSPQAVLTTVGGYYKTALSVSGS